MKSIKKYTSGIVLTFILAYIGILLSSFIPYHLISGSVFALLAGMILNPYISEFGFFKPGINFVSKQILRFSIILMGLTLSFSQVLQVGKYSLIVMVFTLFTAFGGGWLLGKLFGMNWKLSGLISAGTGICGGSAIAAIAPAIDADIKDIAYAISAILVVLSIFSLATKGLNQGVDFVGGRTYQVRFDKAVSAPDVAADLVAVFGSAEAKVYGGNDQLKITTKYKVDEEGEGVDKEVNQKLFEALKKYLPANLTYEKFADLYEGKKIGILSSAKVTGTISKDIKTNSLWAVLGSLFVVFVYLMISFRKWQFGLAAVIAVAHDVIIVLGIFSFFYTILPFNMEIDQAFIAAILTVIGYSLNDTVIVFDRVREYLDYNSSPDFKGLVNKALNTTLSRTINTSATTLVVLVAIFIFGGETIRGFVFAILVGILVGTYSSLFVATPAMADAIGEKEGRRMAEFKKED